MSSTQNQNKSQAFLSFFVGGLLPILAFTLIEESKGPVWGTVAGMIFGIGEILFEKFKYKKVSGVTWVGNLMILGLGGISIVSQEGLWFKLQPALFEAFFAVFLCGSWLMKKPFLLAMAMKQNPNTPEMIKPILAAMTFRLSLFFAAHAALATWAALAWTTAQWAWLKGAGLIASFLFYLLCELAWIRYRAKKKRGPPKSNPLQE
ncbi:MAG: septation protein IspZ [Pseudobdellovibrionaceae bacterium]